MYGRRWRRRWCFFAGLLLSGLFLFLVRAALVPFIYASILTYFLAPMVDFLERRAFSRVTAVMLVYAGVAAILVVFFAGAVPLVLGELEAFANAVPKYSMGITMRLNEMQRLYSKVILPAGLRQVMDENIVRLENTILSYVRGTASFALALFSHMLAIIIAPILSFYMLRDLPLLKKKYLALFQRDDHRALGQLLTQINAVLSGFIRGHLLVALIVALISFLGLSILQVDFALLIGFTAGILDIVPYFGPIIGALPAVVIALLESPLKALYVIVLFFIIHQLESTIVSPKILGDRVGLHPLAVVFVLLAGGQLAGIVGVLLAVPVTAGFKICWDSWGMGPIKVDRQ